MLIKTQKLDIYEFEKPIGIQIFGNNIDKHDGSYQDL